MNLKHDSGKSKISSTLKGNGKGKENEIDWRLIFVMVGFYLSIMILFVIGSIVRGYFK